MSFDSTSKTRCFACRPSFRPVLACRACSADPHLSGVRTSSLGVLKDHPSIDMHMLDAPLRFLRLSEGSGTSPHSITTRARSPRRFCAGPGVHSQTPKGPSARASHCSDMFRPCPSSGLRRFAPPARCWSVAPSSRSWDSPRFKHRTHKLQPASAEADRPKPADDHRPCLQRAADRDRGVRAIPVAPHPSKVSPPRQRPPLSRAPASSPLLSTLLTTLTPKSSNGNRCGDLDLEALLHLRVRGDVPV